MAELLTAAQMRAIEQAAIEAGEVTGLELMERAGQGVVDAVFEEWPELSTTSHRAVVLCGPGNNGGDGFVVARLLKEWGWEVEVFLYGDPQKLPPDARNNCERWQKIGSISPLVKNALTAAIDRAFAVADHSKTIYVDALFGIGLSRKFNEDLLEISGEWIDTCYEHGVAIDILSGLCSDTGECVGGNLFFSKLMVTFETAKIGHYLGSNAYDVGTLNVVDLNLPYSEDRAVKLMTADAINLDENGFFEDGLNKTQRQHKYNHGHALILSGPPGHGGAARLAARGALRIGAGLVTIGAAPEAIPEHAAQLNAIMLRPVASPPALAEMLKDDRLNALCFGPALGLGDHTRQTVETALTAHRKTVLDADALTSFADDPQALFDLLHENCVLTPHAGEFARLFPDITAKLDARATKGPAYSKVDATREAAARAGCTVLFKGPDTMIADQDGKARINSAHYERSAPWLATAGSGDVLAGFITGLLARGIAPLEAASTAAWLHVECALSFGPGLVAEDLPEELPKVFRKLGL